MGMAPQSYAGTTSEISATVIEPNETWVDGNKYYVDNDNPKVKYVLKSGKYYFVEPVRWIILEDGKFKDEETGIYGVDYYAKKNLEANNLSSNQILVVSERLLMTGVFGANLTTLKSKIFTHSESDLLNTVNLKTMNGSSSGVVSDSSSNFFLTAYYLNENFKLTETLNTKDLRKAFYTCYLEGITTEPTSSKIYWMRSKYSNDSHLLVCYMRENGATESNYNSYASKNYGIRPMFVINF